MAGSDHKRTKHRRAITSCVLFLAYALLSFSHDVVAAPLNVLFVAIDDLRPALGCYGDEVAVTPNIDRLAHRGTVFRRAYCQQAVCSPSRLSVLTGMRPDTIRVWDLKTHFRKAVPEAVALPQLFREHGYHTQSIGKIYHGSGKPSKDPPSWSVPPKFDYVRDPQLRYALPENLAGKGLKRSAAESAAVADDHYIDGIVCNAAVQTLREIRQRPFFLAVGFRKPHLPFCAPAKYWKLYDREQIPPPATVEHPLDAPELATRSWQELEGYTDIPNSDEQGLRLPEAKVCELRHGYYACVSYVDSLVGRLLDEVNELGLLERTVIVLWGDHGFHLGEQGLWTKANNYELSTRVPLIFSVPGTTSGASTDRIVELIDIYPTLADVCGLPGPNRLEGTSLKPLLTDPGQAWKRAAFSQYPRSLESHRHQGAGDMMGHAVRTDEYRYIEWRENRSNRVVARELYDVASDPHESRNVAALTEHAAEVDRLSKILWSGRREALPIVEE